jgi:hypothetical protein
MEKTNSLGPVHHVIINEDGGRMHMWAEVMGSWPAIDFF